MNRETFLVYIDQVLGPTLMPRIHKPVPFVILSTGHGTMIVNRNDYRMVGPDQGFGVGMDLFCAAEVDSALDLLQLRRAHYGNGMVALDCGANIGVHTIEWARLMTGWGNVVAFEPQLRIYYVRIPTMPPTYSEMIAPTIPR